MQSILSKCPHAGTKSTRNFVLIQYFCDIPEVCKTQPCVLGVDEAGRGPVLGPMVYGISFCPVEKNRDLKELGVDDSKALTEEQRGKLLDKIVDNSDYIGWAIHVLSPRYISTSMYKRGKYNLNSMSHDCAIGLIKAAIEKGVKVSRYESAYENHQIIAASVCHEMSVSVCMNEIFCQKCKSIS